MPELGTWRYEYDYSGNQAAVVDPAEVRTEYGYDKLDRLMEMIENYVDDPNTQPGSDECIRTHFNYDGAAQFHAWQNNFVTYVNSHLADLGLAAGVRGAAIRVKVGERP